MIIMRFLAAAVCAAILTSAWPVNVWANVLPAAPQLVFRVPAAERLRALPPDQQLLAARKLADFLKTVPENAAAAQKLGDATVRIAADERASEAERAAALAAHDIFMAPDAAYEIAKFVDDLTRAAPLSGNSMSAQELSSLLATLKMIFDGRAVDGGSFVHAEMIGGLDLAALQLLDPQRFSLAERTARFKALSRSNSAAAKIVAGRVLYRLEREPSRFPEKSVKLLAEYNPAQADEFLSFALRRVEMVSHERAETVLVEILQLRDALKRRNFRPPSDASLWAIFRGLGLRVSLAESWKRIPTAMKIDAGVLAAIPTLIMLWFGLKTEPSIFDRAPVLILLFCPNASLHPLCWFQIYVLFYEPVDECSRTREGKKRLVRDGFHAVDGGDRGRFIFE